MAAGGAGAESLADVRTDGGGRAGASGGVGGGCEELVEEKSFHHRVEEKSFHHRDTEAQRKAETREHEWNRYEI